MPNNTTNPEPPANPQGEPANEVNADAPGISQTVRVFGWISLAMALAGALLLIAPLVMPKPPVPAVPLMVIELLWWGATLVFGIIGRRSIPGKIGLIITLTIFSLLVIVVIWLLAQHSVAHVVPVSAPTVPSLPPR